MSAAVRRAYRSSRKVEFGPLGKVVDSVREVLAADPARW
jgi:hypothetical protein